MLADNEREDRRERRGQAALKTAGDGNDGVSLQARERAVRRNGRFGVSEGLEPHTIRAATVGEPHTWERTPAVGSGRDDLEIRLRGEDRKLPDDPIGARTRFTVRNASETIAYLRRDLSKYGLCVGERDAADEVNTVRGQVAPHFPTLPPRPRDTPAHVAQLLPTVAVRSITSGATRVRRCAPRSVGTGAVSSNVQRAA